MSRLASQDAVERSYLTLRDLIVRGAIAPGSPLIERRVAEAVGASRTTVRTALQRLANEGFVSVSRIGSHYSRFLARPLTIEEMTEWYYLYGSMDGIAARHAAALPEKERQTIVRTARPLARAHLEAGSGDDPHYERIQQLDASFHASYVHAGGGPIVLREHARLAPHVERYGRFYATALIRELPFEIFEEHSAIIDAIEAGDPDLAEKAAVTNWRNASVRFADVMRRWGERGNWAEIAAGASLTA